LLFASAPYGVGRLAAFNAAMAGWLPNRSASFRRSSGAGITSTESPRMTINRICSSVALLLLLADQAAAQPSVATLIAPSSDMPVGTIAFTWQSSPSATWYQFWLGRADASIVLDHWYTADAAGCTTGGVCTALVSAPIKPGAYVWYIRAWNAGGYAPWSANHTFTVKDMVQTWSGKLPPSRRFTLVLDNEAVLDNETGLTWQRTVNSNIRQWSSTLIGCASVVHANRGGWRVPTLSELRSLVDFSQSDPALPPGHPFTLTGHSYWTQTATAQGSELYFLVRTFDGAIVQLPNHPEQQYPVWCVRGGMSGSQ
jgi:hypothetical protein